MLGYGLPAATILVQAISSNGIQSLPQDMSRSKLIRDLSVFVSYLQSICAPGESNYVVCTQAAHIISHALDEILEFRPAIENKSTPVLANQSSSGLQIPNSSQLHSPPAALDAAPGLEYSGTDGLDAFDLDSWLKSVDWAGIGSEYTF